MDIEPPSHAEPPSDWDDELRKDLYAAIKIETSKLVEPGVLNEYPDVTGPTEEKDAVDVPEVVTTKASINNGWCKVFAERVLKRLGHPPAIELQQDGDTHTWLTYDGRHYDAQAPEGVSHPSNLPVYGR